LVTFTNSIRNPTLKNQAFPQKKGPSLASTVPWAGDVWGSQRHGGECCISPADSRARAVGPGGSVRGPLCTLRQRCARSDGRNGARWPRFAIVAVLRAPVRTDVSIFRAPEIRAGSAAHEHLRMVCTMPASDSGRLAGTATRGVLCHHPRAGSRVRTACGTCHLSPPPRLVCDLPHGCFASAPQSPWQHTCTCCLVPPCATVYWASYRALCRLQPPFVPGFVQRTAVQGAPIRRIRPRQSNRPHGSEAHSANEPPQAGIGRVST
jgi:hypothetical protein